ncbi:hypothetical protein GCM10011571_29860 [Marinithermofilum abyssi]|uniref:Uncharacterized protein n=1 Tax=Marinithermofilum abyssi TaxID=1571185 RepID=A0A8J2Y9L3_9BACL|nr:hypothetical protein GCM10011571_29860 [Marinithermofilum abyssi]
MATLDDPRSPRFEGVSGHLSCFERWGVGVIGKILCAFFRRSETAIPNRPPITNDQTNPSRVEQVTIF